MASSSSSSPTTSTAAPTAAEQASFEVDVSNDTFKFHAAHFVAFQGFRERLHGHTYRVGVKLLGKRGGMLRGDGYLIDFGCVKSVTKAICKRLNEHFICPLYSTVLNITQTTTTDGEDNQNSVHIECTTDGSKFTFPRTDCAMLPLLHSTAEELAIYLWAEILQNLDSNYLLGRGIHTMRVTVTEAPGQSASFQLAIPTPTSDNNDNSNNNSSFALDVRQFILDGKIVPAPCQGLLKDCPHCPQNFCFKFDPNQALAKEQLRRLAQAINDKQLALPSATASADTDASGAATTETGNLITVEDLEKFL
jgi:dihydroneopterin triphosphate aldolase (PTPS-III) / 6-pyruvoyltetrahydropterin synthase